MPPCCHYFLMTTFPDYFNDLKYTWSLGKVTEIIATLKRCPTPKRAIETGAKVGRIV